MVIKIEQDQLFMFFPFFNIIICEALLYHHHISQSYVHILVKVFLTYTKELMLLPMTFLLGGVVCRITQKELDKFVPNGPVNFGDDPFKRVCPGLFSFFD